MKKIYTAFFFAILLLINFSCDKNNDEELIPSYIQIDAIDVEGNLDINEGTLSHNITDAWVYVDNQLIGVFELPATIPVLNEGEVEVLVRAGIKLNGVSSTRVPYPFYKDKVINDVVLTRKEVTTLRPVVQYDENSIIPWRESFDDSDLRLAQQGDTTIFLTSTQDAFEGAASGRLAMSADSNMFFEATSDTGYVLPRNGQPVFLEMNFKTNHPITIGVYADNPATQYQRALVVLNSTTAWKKIYINLTTAVLNTPQATSYRVFFGTTKAADEEEVIFDIDNLKLIHY